MRVSDALRRFFGEVKTDHRFLRLRFARGMKMILHHQVRSFRHMQRQAIGKKVRLRADRPAAERNIGLARAHAAETRLCALLRPFVDVPAAIGEIKHMMHHRPRGGLHVNGRDPFVLGQTELARGCCDKCPARRREHEIPPAFPRSNPVRPVASRRRISAARVFRRRCLPAFPPPPTLGSVRSVASVNRRSSRYA